MTTIETWIWICAFVVLVALLTLAAAMALAVYRIAIARRDEFTLNMQASRRALTLAAKRAPPARRRRKTALVA
ncbi:hypothetical protein [Rhizobium halophytocola]|uniref:Uncharacterized protein YpmS n=1 Tax=Rhizobium halophytocola TaxID=735519 RepID=A0ABS4E3E0_9HYPH|nr:hypothetical protein [Rhizobium halophytocola]MBP1852462.1 uncharacterized protein YpmS [Rhizobium halophytocola]